MATLSNLIRGLKIFQEYWGENAEIMTTSYEIYVVLKDGTKDIVELHGEIAKQLKLLNWDTTIEQGTIWYYNLRLEKNNGGNS